MNTWKEFQVLCEDIRHNPGKYTWIVLDSIEGVLYRKVEDNE